jgi:hypothetical protein
MPPIASGQEFIASPCLARWIAVLGILPQMTDGLHERLLRIASAEPDVGASPRAS